MNIINISSKAYKRNLISVRLRLGRKYKFGRKVIPAVFLKYSFTGFKRYWSIQAYLYSSTKKLYSDFHSEDTAEDLINELKGLINKNYYETNTNVHLKKEVTQFEKFKAKEVDIQSLVYGVLEIEVSRQKLLDNDISRIKHWEEIEARQEEQRKINKIQYNEICAKLDAEAEADYKKKFSKNPYTSGKLSP